MERAGSLVQLVANAERSGECCHAPTEPGVLLFRWAEALCFISGLFFFLKVRLLQESL